MTRDLLLRYVVLPNGCWEWYGPTSRGGYARQGGAIAVRLLYRRHRGPIPPGMQLDHQCHNRDETCLGGVTCRHRLCVNPWHVEPRTLIQNVLSGCGFSAVNRRKTRCSNGHRFTKKNTYRYKNGMRQCRACHADRERGRRRALAMQKHGVGEVTETENPPQKQASSNWSEKDSADLAVENAAADDDQE